MQQKLIVNSKSPLFVLHITCLSSLVVRLTGHHVKDPDLNPWGGPSNAKGAACAQRCSNALAPCRSCKNSLAEEITDPDPVICFSLFLQFSDI